MCLWFQKIFVSTWEKTPDRSESELYKIFQITDTKSKEKSGWKCEHRDGFQTHAVGPLTVSLWTES